MAAKPPGLLRREGCWLTFSRLSTPFLSVSFPISLEASSQFHSPYTGTARTPKSRSSDRGRSDLFSSFLIPGGGGHTYSLTTRYRAGAFTYWFRFPFLVPSSARTYTRAPRPIPTPTPLPARYSPPVAHPSTRRLQRGAPPLLAFAGGRPQSRARPSLSLAPSPTPFPMEF